MTLFYIKYFLFQPDLFIGTLLKKKVGHEAGPTMEKKSSSRITAGQHSIDLMQRDMYGDITAGDRMREMLGEYEYYLLDAVDRGKKRYSSDFFVVVLQKRERLLQNNFRNYFIPRQTCPTPGYDQIVYHYHHKDDHIEFIWSIPSVVGIMNMMAHKHELDESFHPLLQFVLDFLDGKLEQKAQILNKEPHLKKDVAHDSRSDSRRNTSAA